TVNQRVDDVPTVPKSAGRESTPHPSQSLTNRTAFAAVRPNTSRGASAVGPAPSTYEIRTFAPPVAAPEKPTTTVQDAPTASMPLQVPPAPGKVSPVQEKGALNDRPVRTDAGLLPEFHTVNVWLVGTPHVPKSNAPASSLPPPDQSVIRNRAPSIPSPTIARDARCAAVPSLYVNDSSAEASPVAVGVKRTS